MTNVAIFVPGIMGSELTNAAGKVIWPGSLTELIGPYQHMSDLMADSTYPTDIIRDYGIISQYSQLIKDLSKCGFAEDNNSLVCFPYDWRKTNVLAAGKLADKLDELLAAHGNDAKFTLIGHSMGGLVCRYYLESNKFDGRAAFSKIEKLITLATPHNGSPLALSAILGKDRKMWLRPDQVALFAADDRYPAVYELMPPHNEPFLWDESPSAGLAVIKISDKAQELQLSPQNLDQASTFHQGLNLARRPANVRYFCFVGSRIKTATTSLYTKTGNNSFQIRNFESDGGGDGTVPFASGLLPEIQWFAVGGEHGTIYKDKDLRHRLGILLGKPGLLAADSDPRICVKDYVIEPGQSIFVSLYWPQEVASVDGKVVIEKLNNDVFVQTNAEPLHYQGPKLGTMDLELNGPKYAGVYKIKYKSDDDSEECECEFFVQRGK